MPSKGSKKKKQLDVLLTEAKTTSEAMNFIFVGFKFFLMNHPAKTMTVVLLMLFGPAYVAYQYYTSDTVKTMDAEPTGKVATHSSNFSLMPEALAEDATLLYQDSDDIIINGQIYGKFDPEFTKNVTIWKLKDQPVLLLHDKRGGKPFKIDLSGVSKMQQQEQMYKQYK